MIRVPALRISVRRSVVLLVLLPALLLPVACGGAQTAGPPTPPATALPTATPQPTPTVPPPTAEPPRASAAGASTTPGASYPTRLATGEFLAGDEARDRIALPGTAERAAFEATLASMGTDSPTTERMLFLNTTDPNNPSWTYLPGNGQRLYVAVVQEGGAEKIDPSLHDWRVGNVTGVEMARWQEVTPPPGADNLRLVANGITTVIGAYQGDTLVYWLSTEANNGMGDWRPNDSNMPEGAREYVYNNDRNTWVAGVNEVTYEYRGGEWVEVIEWGEVRDGLFWDGTAWQALPAGEGWSVAIGESGQVQATNAQGESSFYQSGERLTSAQIETRKVVEYVAANSEVINHVPMNTIEFRASKRLQQAISERLPKDLQEALGENPLYMMVWNPGKLEQILGELRIEAVGYEEKISLSDYKVMFTFLSNDEEIPEVFLDYFIGGASDGYRFNAFFDGKTVHLLLRTARYMSTGYNYDHRDEIGIAFDGLMSALAQVSGNKISPSFQLKFSEDTIYDDNNFYVEERGITWLLHPGVGNPYRGTGKNYANMDYYNELYNQGWIPPEVWEMMQ